MKGNKRTDTRPEMRIRSELHRQGFRFRKDFLISATKRKCRPDIVFTRKKLAIFIDGCFWHHCQKHGHYPQQNADYWRDKINRNIERDSLDNQALADDGWVVLRIWEHESIEEAMNKIISQLGPIPK